MNEVKRMKKSMKMALALCLTALLLLAGGCGKKDVAADMLGVWELTDMTGSLDAVTSMQYYKDMGVKVQMAISRTELEMVTTYNGGEEYDHQTVAYRIEGDKFITDAAELVFTLKGDTLTLASADGVTMVYTRK
ncbi:MAG: hypothetical protein IKK57_04995 [Clostridia bacterium]|nr:hypothetical protein [Clostridia bacterium]